MSQTWQHTHTYLTIAFVTYNKNATIDHILKQQLSTNSKIEFEPIMNIYSW